MSKRKQSQAQRKHQGGRRKPGPPAAAVPAAAPAEVVELLPLVVAAPLHSPIGRNWRPTLMYLLLGVLISLGLVTIKVGFEHSRGGPIAERWAFGVLSKVIPQFRPEGPEVVVIDISDMSGGKEDISTGELVGTPRAELLAMLETLVKLRPRSIGVDIDFSPTASGWVDSGDVSFFRKCLRLSAATPITLGVFRTLREPRAAWLGLPEFAPLAGGMWLPTVGLERTPAWTQAPGIDDKLPSLGAKVAAGRGESDQSEESDWLHRFRERIVKTWLHADGLKVGEVLTNYSAVEQLSREALRISKPQDLWSHRAAIEGRIVVVGINRKAEDRFAVPTHDMNLPGVMVHASNAYTLAAQPVWELSARARYVIDFALSGGLIGIAILLQRARRSSSRGDLERSERRALIWLVLGTLAGGMIAVYTFRVLWLDFVLVALSLWLHPKVAAYLHRLRMPAAPVPSAA